MGIMKIKICPNYKCGNVVTKLLDGKYYCYICKQRVTPKIKSIDVK